MLRAGRGRVPSDSPAWHREHTAADVEHYWTDEPSGEEAVAHPEHVARIDRVDTASSTAKRRQLTVMFCDLVGSTALSARLDPKDLRPR